MITMRQVAPGPDALDATLASLQRARAGAAQRLLLRGATVLTMDPEIGDFARGDLLIEGERIAAVGPDLSDAAADGQAVVVELGGTILIPGMQDTHRHCWESQFRRLTPDVDSVESYLETAHGFLAPAYEPADVYAGNLVSALGCIDAGITCVLDFSHNSRTAAHSDAAIEAMADAGIRAVHASCSPLAGPWDEHWPDDLRRLREHHFSSEDQLLTLRLGLLASRGRLAVSPEWLSLARGLGLAVSVDGVSGRLAAANIEKLGRAGLLGPDITLIHCSDLTGAAWEMIADSGTTVSLAPTSDAQIGIAASIPPIQPALDHGVRPSLSGDVEIALSGDLFTQMRVILATQRMLAFDRRYRGDPEAPAPLGVRDALAFATVEGARANRLLEKTGTLTPGKQADVVAIGAQDINTMPLNNAAGTVVVGADARNVVAVLIAGEVRKWGGRVLGHDLEQLRETVTESRDRVAARCGLDLDVLVERQVRPADAERWSSP
jgi:cytosine/adenosine deaminase-related metal-dependent hydrolase